MKIVVALDGSFVALHALSSALSLAEHLTEKPTLYAITVLDAQAGAPDLLASEAETTLASSRALAAERGYALEPHVLRGRVVEEVLKFAHQKRADVIVVGTHGRNALGRLMLGSTCVDLLQASDLPVLAVRSESML